MKRIKKGFICFICDKRYAELEDAEVCERSHTTVSQLKREKLTEDAREHAREYLDRHE